MLSFLSDLKVYLALEPCDMRKSFNGLYGLATSVLKEDPRQGAVFAFCNRRRNRLKLLYFDGTGLWVLAKRLEKGTYTWPCSTQPGAQKMTLAPEALQLLIDGVDLKQGSMRAWYER